MIETRIKSALDGISALSGRVYPMKAPERAGLPCAIYLQESDTPLACMDGPSGISTAVYQVFVLASGYGALAVATAAVRSALDAMTAPELCSVVTAEDTPEEYEDQSGVLRTVVTATVNYFD